MDFKFENYISFSSTLYKKIVSSLLIFTLVLANLPVVDVFANPVVDSDFKFDLTVTSQGGVENGQQLINLDWDPVKFKYTDGTFPTTNYVLARHKIDESNPSNTTGEYKWELRGNLSSNEEIKVLNIFPDISGSDRLATWMSDLNNTYPNTINMSVTKVNISTFNNNPSNYINKVGDAYNYDVVVFGFWDSNNRKDLTPKSSAVVQEFIDAGGGVVFGHDTIQYINNGTLANPNFSKLVMANMGIKATPKNYANWVYSDQIAIKQQGTPTTYPFDIYGQSLKIPMAHTLAQLPMDESNIYMSFEKNYYDSNGNGPYYHYYINGNPNSAKDKDTMVYEGGTYYTNAYLTIDDNVAFIQCGHSSGKTNTAEQMVLANVIYALNQTNVGTSSTDLVQDTKRPTAPRASATKNQLSFDSTDNGSTYVYRVIAYPQGASVSKNWEYIKKILNNSLDTPTTWTDSSGNQYAISTSSATDFITAGIKATETFEYYVDSKPTGEKREGTKINKGDIYTIPLISEGLTKDKYLHIWAYDNANNFSAGNGESLGASGVVTSVNNGVTNINLYDSLESFNTIVNYQDLYNNEISQSNTTTQKFGTTFAPQILSINGYNYNSSDPKAFVTVDGDKMITHKYDKLISKNIYLVEHQRDSLGNDILGSPKQLLFKTITNIDGKYVTYQIPQFLNYDFTGYTLNSSSGDILYDDHIDLTGKNCSFIWGDGGDIYLHYNNKPGDVTVTVTDSTNNKTYGSKTYSGYQGKTITITDIATQIDVPNRRAYTNFLDLLQKYAVTITGDDTDNIVIDLIPRVKTLTYFGVIFEGDSVIPETLQHTTGSAITLLTPIDGQNGVDELKILAKKEVRYNGKDATQLISTIDGGISEGLMANVTPETDENNWEENWDGNLPTVDFTNLTNFQYIAYYKGNLPEESYQYRANYINIKDDSELAPSETVETAIPNLHPLDVKEFKDLNIDGIDGVDFVVDHIVITNNNDKSDTHSFGAVGSGFDYDYSSLYEFLPELGEDGKLVSKDYIVDIYYRPLMTLYYKEYITEPDGSNPVVSAEKTLSVPYGISGVYKNTMPRDEYIIQKALVNGEEVTDPNVVADAYQKVIEVYYRPLAYNLKVEVHDISQGTLSRGYIGYTFKNIALSEPVQFNVPSYSGYKYDGIVLGNAVTTADLYTEEDGVVTFTPTTEGDYRLVLNYKQEAIVKVMYGILTNGKVVEALEPKEFNVFIGDTYEFKLPNHYVGYDLSYIYYEGDVVDVSDIDTDKTYQQTVKSSYQTYQLVYEPITKYKVTLESNLLNGGEVIGAGDYLPGSVVYLNVMLEDGYDFVNWTKTAGEDIEFKDSDLEQASTVNTTNSQTTSFIMPEGDVTIKANLVTEETAGGGGDPIDPIEPVDPVDPINPVDPVEPTEPEEPVLPVIPTIPEPPTKPINPTPDDVYDLVDNPYYKEYRTYTPYINGYPSGLVEPRSNVTRAEVIAIIYNLFGNGYVSDKEILNNVTDVKEGLWYSEAIAFAYDFGIVKGYEDGSFKPNSDITRGELAAILAKFMRPIGENSATHFVDTQGHWSEAAVQRLYEYGVISGYADGTFKPKQFTTRAELVALTNRLIKRPLTFEEDITFPDLPKTHWAYNDMMNAANGGVKPLE